jgi:hypothetical protein
MRFLHNALVHNARGRPSSSALNLRSNKAFRSGQKTFQMTNFVNLIAKKPHSLGMG